MVSHSERSRSVSNIVITRHKFIWKNSRTPVKLPGVIFISSNVDLNGRQMESNKVFDKDEILNKFDGEKEFLTELIEIFINDIPEQLSGIKKAVDKRNSNDLERSTHKLKGAVANFEEKAAFEAALQLEMMGRESKLDGVEEAYETLMKEVECLVNSLKEFAE
ncbi:MAG: Hpt domain-containing protein [Candidatus Scalindua rubra]|uniref:Hpt domain protein n=1 Tax=Candidatus Scalindua brodae TaxID=237368 RepID=A0A0B0ESK7_9BACT|nr:MAG: Hpt domain protein [Candidatus Scalindua brodae]MBZ0109301.1 Hpt domain-containing protein [Candidatus Scalindua rubra]TWU36783.1 Hpt domain protein [Candidatus Brocadiaceae bacterium S225]